MPNNKSETFSPHTPEKKISVQITEREAVLLTKLRAFPFGKVLVHKAEGLIVRIEPTNSILIQPDKESIDLK
jgi:hypothetical protein